MPILHMNTDAVQEVSQLLATSTQHIQERSQQLSTITQQLRSEWEGPSALIFESEMQQLVQQMQRSTEVGTNINQRLLREIEEWLNAANSLDNASIGSANSTPPPYTTEPRTRMIDDLFSKMLPIQEIYADIIDKYRNGQIGWSDLLNQLKQGENISHYLKEDYTLFEKQIHGKEKFADLGPLEIGVAEGMATGEVKFSDEGLQLYAQGEAGAYVVRGEYNGQIAGVDVAADGYIGAEAKGQAHAIIMPGTVLGTAGVNAFVGGRADGSVSKQVEIMDGVNVKGEARGSISYGLGVKAEVEGGYTDGTFKLDVDAGATLGLGGEVGFSIELDVSEAAENITEAGLDAIGHGANLFKDIGKGLIQPF